MSLNNNTKWIKILKNQYAHDRWISTENILELHVSPCYQRVNHNIRK